MIAGRYQIEDVVGTGAMGTVWRGYDTRLRRPVAVKEVHLPEAATDDQRTLLTRRAMAEARHAARVSHPNIVAVHDVVADRGMPCLVMRLVEGRSLSQIVREEGPMSPARVAQIGIALTDALAAAHRNGVVHRDVKPSNVLVTDDGEVLLTDFSIATDSFRGTMSAGSGALGSPGYIAPERLNGLQTGPEADLFGLGATLFCAVEGHGPFDRPDPLAALLATATHPHPAPERAGPLAPLLDSLLVKDPAGRPDLVSVRAMLVAASRAPKSVVTDAPADDAPTTPLPPALDSDATQRVAVGPDAAGPDAWAAFAPEGDGRGDNGQDGDGRESGEPSRAEVASHVAPGSVRRRRTLIGGLVVLLLAVVVVAAIALRGGTSPGDGSTKVTTSLGAPESAEASAADASSSAGTSATPSATASPSGTSSPSASASPSAAASSPAGTPVTEPVGQVTAADLDVTPKTYFGSCANEVTFTVNLSVTVSDAPTDVRYRVSLAPGDTEVAGGGGTVTDADKTFQSTDSVGLLFAQGSGKYAVQAVVESPTRFSPVPVQINVVCIG
ncbi:serine/threonine-protein kinase [Cryptosporangium sp. NPDC051539]|uniref:serine/threonine-protein kinase n=1 Tax=Cryptosporangium sp. NPDC051539 TaxID=3363962 RepID=UPI0037B7817B